MGVIMTLCISLMSGTICNKAQTELLHCKKGELTCRREVKESEHSKEPVTCPSLSSQQEQPLTAASCSMAVAEVSKDLYMWTMKTPSMGVRGPFPLGSRVRLARIQAGQPWL